MGSKIGMAARVRCDRCNDEHAIGSDVRRLWALCNGKMLRFVVLECPNCNSYNICQIDDSACIMLLEKIRNCVMKRRDGDESKELAELYKRTNEKLSERRKNLILSYEGKRIDFMDSDKFVPAGWRISNVL